MEEWNTISAASAVLHTLPNNCEKDEAELHVQALFLLVFTSHADTVMVIG